MTSLLKRITLTTSIIITIFCFFNTSIASSLTATTDRQQVSLSDTFNLVLTTDDLQLSRPTLAPLNTNFDILGISQSSSVNIINNQRTASKQWVLQLIAKKTGSLSIPALSSGKITSQPITIDVTKIQPADQKKISDQQGLSISGEINHDSLYLGAQLLYTVTLTTSKMLSEIQLIPPEIKNATLKQIGNDEQFQRIDGNAVTQVLKRHYLLTPNQAGDITIDPIKLIAVIPDSTSRPSDFFDLSYNPFSRSGKKVIVQSKKLHLTVLPAESSQQWLPAWQLQLKQHWSEPLSNWHVGSPITRRIEISAEGVPAEHLPEITIAPNDNTNIYPDQQQQDTTIKNGIPMATTWRQFAVVPTKSGQVKLPELTIKWWNMKAKQYQVSRLPQQTIAVLPSSNQSTSSDHASTHSSKSIEHSTKTTPEQAQKNSNTSTIMQTHHTSPWFWITLSFAFLWIATIIYFKHPRDHKLTFSLFNNNDSLKSLKKTCYNNNPEHIKTAILKWACVFFNRKDINGIESLKKLIDDNNFQSLLSELERSLWSDHALTFTKGKALWKAIQNYTRQPKKSGANKDDLPPLYDN